MTYSFDLAGSDQPEFEARPYPKRFSLTSLGVREQFAASDQGFRGVMPRTKVEAGEHPALCPQL